MKDLLKIVIEQPVSYGETILMYNFNDSLSILVVTKRDCCTKLNIIIKYKIDFIRKRNANVTLFSKLL